MHICAWLGGLMYTSICVTGEMLHALKIGLRGKGGK